MILDMLESLRKRVGGVAQLGERLNGIQEVRGSIPLTSTGRLASGEFRYQQPSGSHALTFPRRRFGRRAGRQVP